MSGHHSQTHSEADAMTSNTAAGAALPKPLTDHCLALQDEYYQERRVPPPTPAGANDCTFCFRVEFEADLFPLNHMLRWATESWWSTPVCPWGDADVKVTLKPNTLTLEEVRWLFDQVVDCHVAVETVELEADYTGERSYRVEQELPMAIPGEAALKASIAGLRDYQRSLEATVDRAANAESHLRLTLEQCRKAALVASILNGSKARRKKRASS
ncbi:MAG: hypothetical protein AB7O64_06885 [Methylibium sp.]